MAFSYGFFNSKNLDRTYTAENFCDYLGSLVCNGIQDNYGGCFKPISSKTKIAISSGKAWIDGHYFISDTSYIYDFSIYVDESLPRYVTIGICCDNSKRTIEFELLVGTPATNPISPRFSNSDTKTYLTLCTVKIDAGATDMQVKDYRENDAYCGYVRCILGKCRVTDMIAQLSTITEEMKNYNTDINSLTNKVEQLTLKVNEMTGDVVSIGKCGENIDYVIYSNGNVFLKGTGEMYDYSMDNKSPFYENENIKSVVISEGITSVGEFAFIFCDNLNSAVLPSTLKTIKCNSFKPHTDQYVVHLSLNGLTSIKIPNRVTELGESAFKGTNIQTLDVPSSVTIVGETVFMECQNLKTVRYSGKKLSDRMFVRCVNLNSFTIAKSCKEIESGCFNYCDKLTTINYEGSVDDWLLVNKHSNWDGHSATTFESTLVKIQCLDGHMEWNSDQWNEVRA